MTRGPWLEGDDPVTSCSACGTILTEWRRKCEAEEATSNRWAARVQELESRLAAIRDVAEGRGR